MNEGLRDLGCPACKSLQKNKVTSCSKTTVNCLCPHSLLNQSPVSGWKDAYPWIMGDVSLRTSHSDTPLNPFHLQSPHNNKTLQIFYLFLQKNIRLLNMRIFWSPETSFIIISDLFHHKKSCLETWAYPSVLQKDGGLMIIVEQCEECYILHHFQACQASKSNNQTNKT